MKWIVGIEMVDHARTAWKWFCMWAMGAGVVVQSVWMAMPEDLKSSLDPSWVNGIALFLFAAGMVGRMVKQPVVEDTTGK